MAEITIHTDPLTNSQVFSLRLTARYQVDGHAVLDESAYPHIKETVKRALLKGVRKQAQDIVLADLEFVDV